MESDWYGIKFEETETETTFIARETRKDDNEYYWTVSGLAPFTKYKFRVVIILMGSSESLGSEYYPSDSIDTNAINSIVTQPSLVVRTDPSEVEAPSRPIIVSVQQVTRQHKSFYILIK